MDWREMAGRLYGQYARPVDLSELKKLAAMLDAAGMEYEWAAIPQLGGAGLKVPDRETWKERGARVLQNWGSFGGPTGTLECWCSNEAAPEGWLTAEECMRRIRAAMGGERGE